MKKFYETYVGDEFVTALLTQISWTNHLAIMSKAKTMEERQIESAYYERYMLSREKVLPEPVKGLKENPFMDIYVIEFLDMPPIYKEQDFRKALIQNMKDFILKLGKILLSLMRNTKCRLEEKILQLTCCFSIEVYNVW